MLHETGHLPEHYYPVDDLDPDLLSPAEPTEAGAARWDIGVAGRVAATAVTAYADPSGADGWFEEDDPVYGHLRDPYHRVDVRASSRRVVVRHQGQVVAESARPKMLFETGNPTRYYLPFADIDLGRLELSDTVSECPYKGDGQHWHLISDGEPVPDVAWSLPHPPSPTVPTRQIRRRPL